MTGALTLWNDPVLNLQAATKQYVDTNIAAHTNALTLNGKADTYFQANVKDTNKLDLGANLIGDRTSTLAFNADDLNADYSARIIRNAGQNGALTISNVGTGAVQLTGNGALTWNGNAVLVTGDNASLNSLTLANDPVVGMQAATKQYVDAATGSVNAQTLGGLGVNSFLRADASDTHSGTITPASDNAQNLGSGSLRYANVYANIFNGTATTAQYADLAENYEADQLILSGMVVSIGGSKEVTVSNVDADPLVVGIVSTNPAYLMNSKQEGEYVVPVALTGRVPCLVEGIVQRGDMLVSAGNGAARAEANPKLGTVIGKALEDSVGEKDVIEIIVGRF